MLIRADITSPLAYIYNIDMNAQKIKLFSGRGSNKETSQTVKSKVECGTYIMRELLKCWINKAMENGVTLVFFFLRFKFDGHVGAFYFRDHTCNYVTSESVEKAL